MIFKRKHYFGNTWNRIKYGYLIITAVFLTGVYFNYMLTQNSGWVEGPTYWYSFFYTTTMALFGFRRMVVKPTKYIRYQMMTLIGIQAFFLWLLPFHLFDPLFGGLDANGYVMREIFPQGKWTCFAFILFWPLNMSTFGSSTFWTWFPIVQTFGILYYIVREYGKGAYCGWICSCGGMAESLGDEYREKAPHGKTAKLMENMGQYVLLFAVVATLFKWGHTHMGWGSTSLWVWDLYKVSIDVVFAGVLGLGVYFFWGGRIWCRYGCPLAALMHIYTRFSKYRIFSEKKKCISCNICTKVCHMGIDVMNYANKGVPMNDVECVNFSSCIQSYPTQTLGFGQVTKPDSQNRERKDLPDWGKKDWRAGL